MGAGGEVELHHLPDDLGYWTAPETVITQLCGWCSARACGCGGGRTNRGGPAASAARVGAGLSACTSCILEEHAPHGLLLPVGHGQAPQGGETRQCIACTALDVAVSGCGDPNEGAAKLRGCTCAVTEALDALPLEGPLQESSHNAHGEGAKEGQRHGGRAVISRVLPLLQWFRDTTVCHLQGPWRPPSALEQLVAHS